MSHNKLSVGTATPDASGALAVDLNDLSDVTNAPTEGQVLGYTSSAWGGAAPPSLSRVPIVGWWNNGSYGMSVYYFDPNDNAPFRLSQHYYLDTTYVSRTTMSGAQSPTTNTNWAQYYTLKASALEGRTIRCQATYHASGVGSGRIAYQWGVGSGSLATFTPIGPKAEQLDGYSTPCWGIYTVGSSDINLALKLVDCTAGRMMVSSDSQMVTMTIELLN